MAIMQFREALRAALREEMQRDPRVFLMGEEVGEYNGAYKVSEGLLAEFGSKRVIDTPISELGFAAIGVGAAMVGLRPVIEFMTFNFALLAIDQVVNHAAKMLHMSGGQFGVPIVFRGPSGSAGQLAQQHSQSFENWYANVPGLKVVSPSTPRDAKGLLKSAIRDDDPVLVMESELMYGMKGEVPDDPEFLIPIGQADIKRKGTDVTIVSFGKMVHVALEAARELEKDGLSAEVIDLRSLRPIDYETVIRSVQRTNRLVVVEESWPLGGIAAEVAFMVQRQAFDFLDAPIVRITAADSPMAYAPTLVEAYLPNPQKVIEAAKYVAYRL
ncbi:MAG: pyruvate dehydrogenase complex E1 component subunit beta [Bacteroidia bacterium]|nr:pyruvate dehydrogenase complex E1 component subunit beta [Bacteroidia bacterium]MDW8015204.1 pyruvate dehydrogenase complex E1 component subunit beta [Bacteroidia bacterium]